MNNQLLAFRVDIEQLEQEKKTSPAPEIPVSSAESYLTDESRMYGHVDRLFFPRSEQEIAAVLESARAAGLSVTISGGRTGITGGAVPMGGWLMSLEKMNHILGLSYDREQNELRLRCQPGVSLESVCNAVGKREFVDADLWSSEDKAALSVFKEKGAYIFPPDPTEQTATFGGMIACNASGARTLYYGATRNYVSRLRIVLADGSVVDMERGNFRAAKDRSFQLVLPDGQVRKGLVPGYVMPHVKNAAGYFAAPQMDLLDLFIGSEGTLGVFSEMEIRLIPAPETILGVIGFFSSEQDSQVFVRAARGEKIACEEKPLLPERPLALEYFDVHALNLLRDQKQKLGQSSPIPALPEDAHTAVYIELAATEDHLDEVAEALLMLLESCGCRSDTAWTAFTPDETERLKTFRHALPEAVNQRIGERAVACPGLTKLGTDFAVPDEALEIMMSAYCTALDGANLEYVIFGHIGNNHLHVNILPRDKEEYEKGKAIYMELAKQALSCGGTVSGEHGTGKLKKPLLKLMVGDSGIEDMRAVKRVFDPHGILNPGNMFDL